MSNVRFSIIPARAVFDPNLERAALHVLNALGTYGDRGGWCRPSLTKLAERFGCSRQAIQKQIKILKELGYLEVSTRYRKNGGQSSNLYRIRFDVGEPDAETLFGDDEDEDTPATSDVAPPTQRNRVAHPVTSEVAPRPQPDCVAPILERPSYERPNGTRNLATLVPKKGKHTQATSGTVTAREENTYKATQVAGGEY